MGDEPGNVGASSLHQKRLNRNHRQFGAVVIPTTAAAVGVADVELAFVLGGAVVREAAAKSCEGGRWGTFALWSVYPIVGAVVRRHAARLYDEKASLWAGSRRVGADGF